MSKTLFTRVSMVSSLVIMALLLMIVPVTAHEHRHVEGYEITFGWRVEPAYTELFNGPEIAIEVVGEDHEGGEEAESESDHEDTSMTDHHEEEVEMAVGAEETLMLDVMYGGQTKTLRLRAVFGEPGHYTADLIPTQPGDYAFRLYGTLGDVEIDETFDSADGDFSSVEPVEDIRFP